MYITFREHYGIYGASLEAATAKLNAWLAENPQFEVVNTSMYHPTEQNASGYYVPSCNLLVEYRNKNDMTTDQMYAMICAERDRLADAGETSAHAALDALIGKIEVTRWP